jgi:hypothetical protein
LTRHGDLKPGAMRGGREDGVAALLRDVGNRKVRPGWEEIRLKMPLTKVNLLGKDDWIVSFRLRTRVTGSGTSSSYREQSIIYTTCLPSNGHR